MKLLVILFLCLNSAFALERGEIVDIWKKVETSFYKEIIEKGESIDIQWVSTNITQAAAISHNLPRKLFISESLLKVESLKKENLYNIFCHELGHILGGAPFIEEFPGDARKISTEGQADYFASAKCMKRLIKEEDYEYFYIPVSISLDLVDRGCEDRKCQLISYFSYETLELFSSEQDFRVDDFADNTVDYTYAYKNSNQCRLDTFISGAICPVDENLNFSNESQSKNACHWRSLDTFFRLGARPNCWFRPFTLDSFY